MDDISYRNLKVCSKCSDMLEPTLKNFHRDQSTEDGLNRQCKECVNKYYRERQRRVDAEKMNHFLSEQEIAELKTKQIAKVSLANVENNNNY